MRSKERIEQVLKQTETLLDGHFLLTSGKHSTQYMQCAKILQHPTLATELISDLAEAFGSRQADLVISPAVGGLLVGFELARQLDIKNIFAEREQGEMCIRRGFTIPQNARVIVCEDVITTGGTVQEVINLVKEMGANVIGVGVLVDRSKGQVDFGVATHAVYAANVMAYEPTDCPLCKQNEIPLTKPGSRNFGKIDT